METATRADGAAGVGFVVPYDFALDREMWRWAPPEVTLHLTRTPFTPVPVTLEQARAVADHADVAACVRNLLAVDPLLVGYACTSGSFVAGVAGERALAAALLAAGAPRTVTTSGALLEAIALLGARRVAVCTPYDRPVTRALGDFLREAGVEVVASAHLGLAGHIWALPLEATRALVRSTLAAAGRDGADAVDAVVVSCTNLLTYDAIVDLEAETGVAVLTANQVTMWAALRRIGLRAVGPGQRLLEADAGEVASAPTTTSVAAPVAASKEPCERLEGTDRAHPPTTGDQR